MKFQDHCRGCLTIQFFYTATALIKPLPMVDKLNFSGYLPVFGITACTAANNTTGCAFSRPPPLARLMFSPLFGDVSEITNCGLKDKKYARRLAQWGSVLEFLWSRILQFLPRVPCQPAAYNIPSSYFLPESNYHVFAGVLCE